MTLNTIFSLFLAPITQSSLSPKGPSPNLLKIAKKMPFQYNNLKKICTSNGRNDHMDEILVKLGLFAWISTVHVSQSWRIRVHWYERAKVASHENRSHVQLVWRVYIVIVIGFFLNNSTMNLQVPTIILNPTIL